MEEIYSETYLKAKAPLTRIVARAALIVVAAFALLIGVIVMMSFGTALVLIAMIVVAGVIYFVLPATNIAYEYIFVDGQIDFDRILNGEKRKTLKRVDLDNIEIVAPEGSHRLDPYNHLPVVDYSSGYDSDKHYIAVASGDKGNEQIRFTPDEKMLSKMKMKAPSKIMEE
ncbi:MAG: hypothetical protein HFH73_01350 [Lachnospiraceae bacterium]|jgi:hypothetical protein|nr:hypothetical protein [Lachnospiraceae bacterium]